jgi:hypothetical protein
MDNTQFEKLLDLLEDLSTRQWTLTSATDWPLLIVIGSLLVGVLVFIWADLKATIREHRGEWREELDRHKVESERAVAQVWTAIKDCQSDCCPREKH